MNELVRSDQIHNTFYSSNTYTWELPPLILKFAY